MLLSNSCYLSSSSSFIERFISGVAILHTAAAPAVRAPGKTELSNSNDALIAFFFTANAPINVKPAGGGGGWGETGHRAGF